MVRACYSILTVLAAALLIFSCGEGKKETQSDIKTESNETADKKPVEIKTIFTLKDYLTDNKSLSDKTDSVFNSIGEDERIGQLIVPSAGSLGKPKETIEKLIREKKTGGVVLLKGPAEQFESLINSFKKAAYDAKCLPLIFSCDAEPSLFNDKFTGSPSVIPAEKIESIKVSGEVSLKITQYIKKLGFNQNYAPVCDFDINREIIGSRSFGSDVTKVSMLAGEFVKVSQGESVIATAKHFPGHGTVKGDSHNSIVYIDGELKELNVFINMIKDSVLSVMVGHIAVSNNKEYDTKGMPSSISKTIVTDLLRTKLGFKGLIVTDAMNMGAVIKFQSPSLSAVKAGCDMILMPTDESRLHESIKSAILTDENLKKQVYESVKRIIRMKICLGII